MLRIETLGGLAVRLPDGRPPSAAGTQPRRLALLALLGRAGVRGVMREKAVAVLWPDTDDEAGRRGLTQALYGLRTGLAAEELVLGVQELRLNPEVASCDVVEFEDAIESGAFERAASLYKGPFLDGFRVPNAPEFDRWADETRNALAHRHAEVLERLARRSMERGDAAAAATWWRRRAGTDPLDSRVALELMRALAAAGDRAGALQHARVHAALVEQEVGLVPLPELVAFADSLRRNALPAASVPVVAAPPPSPAAGPPAATSTVLPTGPVARAAGGARPALDPPSPVSAVPAHAAGALANPTVVPPSPTGVASPPAVSPVATSPVATSPVATSRAATSPPGQHRAARWLLAGGVVGAGLVLAVAMRGGDDAGDRLLQSLRLADPRLVTNDEGLELDPAISPDATQIAYAAGTEGAMRIFVRQRAGSRPVAVSGSIGGDHRRPRWSPDGAQLLFQAGRGIWRAPALGGAPRVVIAAPGDTVTAHSPAWSPDGKEIAWVVRDTVYVRPLEEARPRVIATLAVAHSLAWSPDGRWLAAVSGNAEFIYQRLGNLGPSALYLLPARCNGPAPCDPVLLAPPTSLNTSPDWLDAARLVFVSSRGGARDVFAMRVDAASGAADEPVRLSAGQDVHTVSVASDGRTMTYGTFRQSSNIWSLPITPRAPRRSSEATRVTSGRQTVESLALSPDGGWLAFDANRTGQQDIYVVPVTGGEPRRVVDTPQDDFHPSWSPDGRWLAFHTFLGGVRRAATVAARGSPISLVHPDGPLREEHTPVWMGDGNGLVYWRTFTHGTELYAVRRTSDSTWSEERQLTRRGGLWPSFSGDGSRMSYMVLPGLVKVMGKDLDEASSRVVLSPPAPGSDGVLAHNAVISPDGATVIVKGEDRVGAGFWSVPVAGGAPRLLARLDDPNRASPRPEFASDGKRLFFMLTEREADVWAMRLETH